MASPSSARELGFFFLFEIDFPTLFTIAGDAAYELHRPEPGGVESWVTPSLRIVLIAMMSSHTPKKVPKMATPAYGTVILTFSVKFGVPSEYLSTTRLTPPVCRHP